MGKCVNAISSKAVLFQSSFVKLLVEAWEAVKFVWVLSN